MRLQLTSALLLPLLISADSILSSNPSEPILAIQTVAATPTKDSNLVPDTTLLPQSDALDRPEYPHTHVDLRARQAGGGAGQTQATAATVATQMDPTMTLALVTFVGGTAQAYSAVYTQTFAPFPDQWPAAAVGTIGLGAITGEIGVVKTKRDLPAEVPLQTLAPAPASAPAEVTEAEAEAEAEESFKEDEELTHPQQRKQKSDHTSVLENRSGKLIDSSAAGSALALSLAIAAMVFI